MASIGDLYVQIGANTSALENGIGRATSAIKQFATIATSALAIQVGSAMQASLKSLQETIMDTIDSYNVINSAIVGLSATLNAQGRNTGAATKYLQQFVSDGLIPMNEAVATYKLLAQRGYNTKQIEDMMIVFKDTASFARQGSLKLGQAVRGTAEGFKNTNSVMSDNGGITTNISIMWEQYAATIGTTIGKLSKAQKIEAEYQGVMKEHIYTMGDAARYAETLGGQMTKLGTTFTYLKSSIGEAIAPLALQLVPALIDIVNKIKSVAEAFNKLDPVIRFAVMGAISGIISFVAVLAIALPIISMVALAVTTLGIALAPLLGWTLLIGAAFAVLGIIIGVSLGRKFAAAAKSAKAVTVSNKKVEESIDKTTKKAKNALMPFDEINQLQEEMAASAADAADAGGIGDIGAGSGGDEVAKTTEKTNLLTEAMKKLKEAFGPSLTELDTAFTNLKKSASDLWDKIKPFVTPITDNIFKFLKGYVTDLANNGILILNGVLKELTGFFEILDGVLSGNFDKVLKGFKDIWQGLWDIFKGIVSMAFPPLKAALEEIEKKVETSWTWIRDNVGPIYEAAKTAITTAWDAISTKTAEVWNWISDKIQTFWNWMNDNVSLIFDAVKTTIITSWDTISTKATEVWDAISSKVQTFWNWIKDNAALIFDAAKKSIVESWDAISIKATEVWDAVSTKVTTFWNWVKDNVTIIWDAVKVAISTSWDAILTKATEVWDSVSTKVKDFWNWANDNASIIWDGIKTTISTSWDAISTKATIVWDAVSTKVTTFWNWVKDNASIFTTAKTTIITAFEAIGTTVSTVWTTIGTNVKSGINTVLGYVNSFIKKINEISIKIPSVDIPGLGAVGGGTLGFSIPEIKPLAKGGITTGATLAQIGEAGTEAVLPLQNQSTMDQLGSIIASSVLNAMQFASGSTSSGSQTLEAILNIDGASIARALIPAFSKEQARMGNTAISTSTIIQAV